MFFLHFEIRSDPDQRKKMDPHPCRNPMRSLVQIKLIKFKNPDIGKNVSEVGVGEENDRNAQYIPLEKRCLCHTVKILNLRKNVSKNYYTL